MEKFSQNVKKVGAIGKALSEWFKWLGPMIIFIVLHVSASSQGGTTALTAPACRFSGTGAQIAPVEICTDRLVCFQSNNSRNLQTLQVLDAFRRQLHN